MFYINIFLPLLSAFLSSVLCFCQRSSVVDYSIQFCTYEAEGGQNKVQGAFLVDSGANNYFIELQVVKQSNIATAELPQPVPLLDFDGRPLSTPSLTLKSIPLFFIPSPSSSAVLGSPRLRFHNLQVKPWESVMLTGWVAFCHSNCLHLVLTSQPASPRHPVRSKPSPCLLTPPMIAAHTFFLGHCILQLFAQPFQTGTGSHGKVCH